MAVPGSWQTQSYGGMQYQLLLPDGYTPGEHDPVLLFLHGGSQSGLLPTLLDPWFNTSAFRTSYRAIVVAPQLGARADNADWGGYPGSGTASQDQALAIVRQVTEAYAADRNRIYVTGLSLGGHGAWDLMIKDNAYNGTNGRVFAAALPLAGFESDLPYATLQADNYSSVPKQAIIDQLRNVPIWAVEGETDGPAFDRAMAAANPDGAFHYTELRLGHDVWDTVYPLPFGRPYYDWLFSQSAGMEPSAAAPPTAGFIDSGGQQGVAAMQATSGGPSYLQWQYIWPGASGVALSTSTPNVFLHGGPGQDAIEVTSGQNVLDGGTGSNFLTGGTGTDTFFTDARGNAVVWNTLRSFHAGDSATLWGFVPGLSSYAWDPAEGGAPGATGATLRANIVGGGGRSGDGIDASITFAGLSVQQARALLVSTGTQPAGSYLFFYNPGV